MLLHYISKNNRQYLGKIEQAHYKALFLVGSKARDEVGTFASHNKTQSMNETQLLTTRTPLAS